MSIDRDVVVEILRDACRAPSADNTQPWKFSVKGNRIRVHNAGDQVESIFNYRQQVNHTSLGAAVENLRISAEEHGLGAQIRLFPDANDPLVIAAVTLMPAARAQNELASLISTRASNRKKYHAQPVAEEKLSELASLAEEGFSRIVFVTGGEVSSVARIISAGEKLALESKSIHDFLFEHVTWTKEEDATKHGFLIDTFEFALPQKVLFKFFRNWNILRFFIPLGFPNFVAKDMEKVYATSGAFGAILTKGDKPEDFVRGGMLFERFWLFATKLGLSLQPTTGLQFFAQPVIAGDTFGLSEKTSAFIRERYQSLKEAFGAKPEETIALAFRLGYADAPSATTTRFEPNVSFED